ncbi:MAG TPA: hypothetical protein PJ986_14115 [Gammaproteobacteria bacterium]|nr:hypothetical protein [Gammaproteobacteria bacterium]
MNFNEIADQLYGATTGARDGAPAENATFLAGRTESESSKAPPGEVTPAANIDAVLPGQLYAHTRRQSAVDFVKRDERAHLMSGHQISAIADVVQPLMDAMGIDHRHHEVLQRAITHGPSATDEQRLAWRREAEDRLHGAYGDRWQEVHALARRWVARDPQVADWLTATGAGDHPDLVEAVAEIAWQKRLQDLHE